MSFTLIAGQPQAPPQPPFNFGTAGLLSGGNLTLMIASGATRAKVAVYNYVARVNVIDPEAFAALSSQPGAGWGSPRILTLDATTPTQIGGSGANGSPLFAAGAAFYAKPAPGSMMPGPPAGPGNIPTAIPRTVPADPLPIATTDGGPIFVSLIDTDAASGSSVVFALGGS